MKLYGVYGQAFILHDGGQNNVLISGASPNAGKTFISTNLAAIIASTGKKILFIDADLRKGYVHKMLGFSESAGLSNILSGQKKLKMLLLLLKNGL